MMLFKAVFALYFVALALAAPGHGSGVDVGGVGKLPVKPMLTGMYTR
jgi:hypothetical protein